MPTRAPCSLAVPLTLCIVWALWGGVDGVEAHAAWQRPVSGAVAAPFEFDAADPYARGQRRGVAFATRAGTRVRAACAGRVSFAGPLPAAPGAAVTVQCGQLAATHLGLTSPRVRRGTTIRRGAVLGTAAGDTVRLGARRIGERHGYLDPLTLLAATGHRDRPFTAPLTAPRHRPSRPAAPAGPAAAPLPAAPPSPAPSHTPALAWLGLALLALGVPAGGGVAFVRRRRRQRPAVHARGAALRR